ncbi:hypothetical protein, partial [Escherichia coli]|uniref:hypothetical protein n=1 Tax=Escherichia coli TaxID=562 RepID=UPI00338EC080
PAYGPQNDVTLKMPAFEWVHVQLHQQKGMISLSPPTICNSAEKLRNELLQSSGYCYLNGARYSTGTVLYGRICQNQSGSASWQVYSRR